MSYIKLNDLSTVFHDAAIATVGLDSYLMIDESELNGNHNIDYPLCLVEPPNSVVSNVNKSLEEYDVNCYILQVDDSSISNVIQYDQTLALFTEFLGKLMAQRDGLFIIQKDSIVIERVRNIGNDKLIGVKVGFDMLVPSVLIASSDSLTLSESDLYGHWSADKNVTVTRDTLSWGSLDGTKTITHSGEVSQSIPAFAELLGAFIFQGFSSIGQAEAMILSNVTFPTADYSIFFRLTAPLSDINEQTLFEFPTDAEGDYSRVTLIGGGIHSGKFKITVDDDRGNRDDFSFDSSRASLGSRTRYSVVGFVNDSTAEKTTIYIGDTKKVSDNYRDDIISGSTLHFGARHLPANYGDFAGFNGTISHISIYSAALTTAVAKGVVEHLGSIR